MLLLYSCLCFVAQLFYGASTVGGFEAKFVDLVLYLENGDEPLYIIPVTLDEVAWKENQMFVEWITFNIYYPTLACPILDGSTMITRQLCKFSAFLEEKSREENVTYVGDPKTSGIYTNKNFFRKLLQSSNR